MKFIKIFLSRPKLILSFAIGAIVHLSIQILTNLNTQTSLVISLNIMQISFLVLFVRTMLIYSHQEMQKRAITQDEGKHVILIMVICVAVFTIGALIYEIQKAKATVESLHYYHAGLAFFTVITSWLFSHTMFAIHYAHDYYLNFIKNKNCGLRFPETEKPDYFDFLYFSFIIGTSAQTADVSFTNQALRKTGLLHCVFAYFFNTSILALAINLGSSFL